MANVFAKDALAGEVVLVTGASRGIGAAILDAAAAAGAAVVGTATSEEGAARITARLGELGARGRGAVLNVTDAAAIDPLVAAIAAEFGPVSVLVNNAGITRDGLAMRMKDEQWDAVLATNLTSVFRMSRAVLRGMMRARHGRIITVSSIVGAMGNPGQCNYAAAKAGVVAVMKSLGREVGSRGITCNAVAPGFIDTDMTRALPETAAEALKAQIPAGRLGDPSDIAQAVVFLASPAAAYINGATIHVNGGMGMF